MKVLKINEGRLGLNQHDLQEMQQVLDSWTSEFMTKAHSQVADAMKSFI